MDSYKRCVCGQYHCPACQNQIGTEPLETCPICEVDILDALKDGESEPIDIWDCV
jgi:hypothetical protein